MGKLYLTRPAGWGSLGFLVKPAFGAAAGTCSGSIFLWTSVAMMAVCVCWFDGKAGNEVERRGSFIGGRGEGGGGG